MYGCFFVFSARFDELFTQYRTEHGMYMLIVDVRIAYIVYYMIFCRCKPEPVSNHQDGKPGITKWRSHLLTVTR